MIFRLCILSLNTHVAAVHGGNKQFKCDFALKSNLKQHVGTVHEGKKQFKCKICCTSFGENGSLKKHVTGVHEGKKQFKCEICNGKLGKKGNLNTHVATFHEGNKQFKCEEGIFKGFQRVFQSKASITNVTFELFLFFMDCFNMSVESDI